MKTVLSLTEYLKIVTAIGNATGGFEMILVCEQLTESQNNGIKNILGKLREAAEILQSKTINPVTEE